MADEETRTDAATASPATASLASAGVARAQGLPAETPPDSRDVEMHGETGEPLGFHISLSPGRAEDGEDGEDARALGRRVTGWTPFQMDGKPYEYSEHNAIALLNRFPHFAQQLRKAA